MNVHRTIVDVDNDLYDVELQMQDIKDKVETAEESAEILKYISKYELSCIRAELTVCQHKMDEVKKAIYEARGILYPEPEPEPGSILQIAERIHAGKD